MLTDLRYYHEELVLNARTVISTMSHEQLKEERASLERLRVALADVFSERVFDGSSCKLTSAVIIAAEDGLRNLLYELACEEVRREKVREHVAHELSK